MPSPPRVDERGVNGLRVGLKTAPIRVGWADLEAVWRRAGERGAFDSLWLYDHFYPNDGDGSCFEGVVALAGLAHLVPRATVGHLVLANPYRHPAHLAKMAATMDHVSGGRFILGLGAGWHEAETEAYGMDLAPVAQRLRDLRASIAVIRALLSDEAGRWPGAEAGAGASRTTGGVSLDAPPFRLDHARNDPLPVQGSAMPIWLGVQGERVGLPMAGELADGWNFSGVGSLDDFRRRRSIVLEAAERSGRPAGAIEISAQLKVDPVEPREGLDRCAAFIESGCDHVILYLDPRAGPAGVDLLADEVVAPLRALRPGG